MNSEKKKLTLSINSEVIEKAKKLGLNLSEITENALKISSLSPDDKIVTPDQLREAYIAILKEISKILKKWDTKLEIGPERDLVESTDSSGKKIYFYDINYNYILSSYGVELWSIPYEVPDKIWEFDDENLPVTSFYDPEKIITNLINALYNKTNKNKEILNKLQILKNILELSGLSK